MSTNLSLQSWGCHNCPYYQQFDPTDAELVAKNFPEAPDLPTGACPACWMGLNPQRTKQTSQMGLLLNAQSPMETRVASDAELEAQEVPDLDANGQPIMIESGEVTERIGIVDGAIGIIREPVMVQKMRSLTDEELAELQAQRDQNLDALSAVAVSEVTEAGPAA